MNNEIDISKIPRDFKRRFNKIEERVNSMDYEFRLIKNEVEQLKWIIYRKLSKYDKEVEKLQKLSIN